MYITYESTHRMKIGLYMILGLFLLTGCRNSNITPTNSSLSSSASPLPTRIVLTVQPPTAVSNSVGGKAISQFQALAQVGGMVSFSTNHTGVFEIGVADLSNGQVKLLTTSPQPGDAEPNWSKDGKYIVFNSGREGIGQIGIYRMDADGSHQQIIAPVRGNGGNFSPEISPDGKHVLFHSNRDGNMEVYVINTDGLNEQNLTQNRSNDITASWSPDGTKITFVSDRSGMYQIYSMNADGSNVHLIFGKKDYVLIRPRYSQDGKMILFGIQEFGSVEYGLASINADGSNFRMITSGHGQYTQGAWIGTNMVIYSGRENENEFWQLYVINLDGTKPIQISAGNEDYRNPYWTPK